MTMKIKNPRLILRRGFRLDDKKIVTNSFGAQSLNYIKIVKAGPNKVKHKKSPERLTSGAFKITCYPELF